MTRAERTIHWRLWLIIVPVLAALFVFALAHRPRAHPSSPPAQEAKP